MIFSLTDKILGGALAALLILCVVFAFQKTSLRADLAEARAQNAAYTAQNDQLKTAAETQSEAVKRLEAEGKARAKAATEALAAAQKAASVHAARAAQLRAAKASASDCEATSAFLHDYRKGGVQ